MFMTQKLERQEPSRIATSCVFCAIDAARIVWSSPLALAVWDAFPVSRGHALILPRRHTASWGELTDDEKAAILAGIDHVRAQIAARFAPHGYNVGCNDGIVAGQTVMHFHMHVIPRYVGDSADPRGGIRWVLPEKAAYWTQSKA
jgi:diadenosine tetraphosphate (Ap4A) HIT family hydrolase